MRNAAVAFVLLFTPVLHAAENPSLEQRVEALEQEVQELKANMGASPVVPAATAAKPATRAESTAPSLPAAPPGWQDRANWKKLRYGLLQPQVQALLGEPAKAEGTRYNQRWLYPDESAWVQFDSEKEVSGWQAPP
jgi:hypothetical protein